MSDFASVDQAVRPDGKTPFWRLFVGGIFVRPYDNADHANRIRDGINAAHKSAVKKAVAYENERCAYMLEKSVDILKLQDKPLFEGDIGPKAKRIAEVVAAAIREGK